MTQIGKCPDVLCPGSIEPLQLLDISFLDWWEFNDCVRVLSDDFTWPVVHIGTALSYWLSENVEMASLEAVSNSDQLRYSSLLMLLRPLRSCTAFLKWLQNCSQFMTLPLRVGTSSLQVSSMAEVLSGDREHGFSHSQQSSLRLFVLVCMANNSWGLDISSDMIASSSSCSVPRVPWP